jgi:tripartite-type tricarboxylate transporter receptor subunit TctC
MSVRSRTLALAGVAAAMLAQTVTATLAVAQDWPTRPIRFLQGFPAGGNADVIARALGEEISKTLGQPVIAEARPGASGNLATEQVVRAQPDGYQIVLLTTAHVISPALLKSISFDPVKDLDFISWVVDFPFFLAVHNDSPFKTVNELIAAAKAKPDSLNWGSAGTGSGQHMSGELMLHVMQAKARHVPFRGDAGSVTALLSKSIDFIMAPSTVLVGNIDGGNFRALAVSSQTRAPALPNVPTMTEALKADIEMQALNAIATTKGTPAPILARLTSAVHAAVKSPGIDKRLRDMGGTPSTTTNAEMAQKIEAHVKRWKQVVEAAGIKAE